MLFLLSDTEDPTASDVVVVEATTAQSALASQDWIEDGDEIYTWTIAKASKEKFVASHAMVFTKGK